MSTLKAGQQQITSKLDQVLAIEPRLDAIEDRIKVSSGVLKALHWIYGLVAAVGGSILTHWFGKGN